MVVTVEFTTETPAEGRTTETLAKGPCTVVVTVSGNRGETVWLRVVKIVTVVTLVALQKTPEGENAALCLTPKKELEKRLLYLKKIVGVQIT